MFLIQNYLITQYRENNQMKDKEVETNHQLKKSLHVMTMMLIKSNKDRCPLILLLTISQTQK